MKKITYINEMPYIYDTNHTRSHYLPNGSKKYKNRGEIIESIVKYHRGLYTESNPNTSWNTGSDIETEFASVKSSEGGLGRNIGGYKNSASEKIKEYFKNTASKVFIWVEWNEETQKVTEYQMNKKEFGAFIQKFTRVHMMSNHKEICIRFRPSSQKMLCWLESKVE